MHSLQKWQYQKGVDNNDNYLEETVRRMAQYLGSRGQKMADGG